MPFCFNSPQAPSRLRGSQHAESQPKWLEFDEVVSNFKTTFILHTISPLSCILGFYETETEKNETASQLKSTGTRDLL